MVLELTDTGERLAEEGALERHLRKVLQCGPAHPVFVPYTVIVRHKRRSVINVIEGYAFVATGLQDVAYLRLPTRSPHIKTVMHRRSTAHIVTLTPVPDKSILDLKARLRKLISQDIEIGSDVRVHEGLHRGLVGQVVDVFENDAFVLIKMRTLETIRVFPRHTLRPATGVLGFDSPSEIHPSYDPPDDPDDAGVLNDA